MDPRYTDNLEKIPLSLVLLQEKNCEKRGAFLAYWRLTSLLSFEKELGFFSGDISSTYYIRKLINKTYIFVEEY